MNAFVGSFAVASRPSTFVSTRTALVRPASKAVSRKAPARMSLSTVNSVATTLQGLNLSEGMAVTFPAYLAVFLGTLIPCAFLVILYIQAETRKAGERAGRGETD